MKTNRMLLLKAWLETRMRILFPLVMFVFVALLWHSAPQLQGRRFGARPAGMSPFEAAMVTMPFFLVIAMVFLGGNGIRTQSTFRPLPGLHGSTYYTLSLPVSRLRLLAVRATLGYVEASAVIALICFAIPWMIPGAPGLSPDFARYWLAVVVCGSAYYSLSVLLSTFLDDFWHLQSGMLSLVASAWLFNNQRVPDSLNLYHALGAGSPLYTHVLPWVSMGASLVIAAVLLTVSWRIVQSAEY